MGLLATTGVGAAACSDDDGGGTTATSTSGSGGGATTGGGGGATTGTGGGATSGTGGGATTGTGGAGGGDTACADGALICDDFESYEGQGAPGDKWKVYTAKDGSAVTVDTTRAFSGTKSVKVTTPASSGDDYKSAMIQFQDPAALPVEGNVVHGRMMFFLESAPDTDVHWTIIDGAGTVPGKDFQGMPYTAVYRYGGQHPIASGSQLMANYDTPGQWTTPPTGPTTDCWHHAEGKVVPVGEWTCVEFSFDGPNNEMRFWLNNEEITELKMSGTGQGCANNMENFEWTAPEFTSIGFGWESYQPDQPRNMWIDDVVISTAPIGCPQQ
ncbi:hypothetical protein [Sorangium sp. So ce1335]|uniref:hypothetical protein n=1 Tax=Sorangium sp. So ce1335 TaxID=3133335 RepID=UPI003F623219